jgi:aquaporin Z
MTARRAGYIPRDEHGAWCVITTPLLSGGIQRDMTRGNRREAVQRWPAYAIETAGLATFMVAAVAITGAIEHPASPIRQAVTSDVIRRLLIGLGMGMTAATLIYSPWGRRSGAHLNPSVTLTYFRLGKISAADAVGYVLGQFIGAAAGIGATGALMQKIAGDASVNYVATVPGLTGAPAAFAGELVISFLMMTGVLVVSNQPQVARYTGALAASLIALYITLEAPLSGMSMNPARSFAPALATETRALWIYFTAPPLGMLLAAEVYVRRRGKGAVRCAKLHHPSTGVCHFHCTP